jgi:hypothetical protein
MATSEAADIVSWVESKLDPPYQEAETRAELSALRCGCPSSLVEPRVLQGAAECSALLSSGDYIHYKQVLAPPCNTRL